MRDTSPQPGPPGRITEILQEVHDGTPGAPDQLMELVMTDLRRFANWRLSRASARGLIRPTELINETYIKLFGRSHIPSWEDRKHFFAVASRAMQHIIVDCARRHLVRGAGGIGGATSPDRISVEGGLSPELLVELDEALARLEQVSPRRCLVVRLKFFGGMTINDIAELLEMGTATVEREWAAARAWLRGALVDL